MTGFEPRISGIVSDRSTNWATTTACTSYDFGSWQQIKQKHVKVKNLSR